MGDLTLVLTNNTEIPITEYKNSEVELSVSIHNERYARVYIEAEGFVDDCVINESEYWPLEAEISRLTGIKEVNHYPNRIER